MVRDRSRSTSKHLANIQIRVEYPSECRNDWIEQKCGVEINERLDDTPGRA